VGNKLGANIPMRQFVPIRRLLGHTTALLVTRTGSKDTWVMGARSSDRNTPKGSEADVCKKTAHYSISVCYKWGREMHGNFKVGMNWLSSWQFSSYHNFTVFTLNLRNIVGVIKWRKTRRRKTTNWVGIPQRKISRGNLGVMGGYY
jgi:hypothetical protein